MPLRPLPIPAMYDLAHQIEVTVIAVNLFMHANSGEPTVEICADFPHALSVRAPH